MTIGANGQELSMGKENLPEHAVENVVTLPPPYQDSQGYRAHMMEQHKHFVDVTLRYWSHIGTANQFFVSLHTVILGGFTYVIVSDVSFPPTLLVVLTTLACAFALHWLVLLRSLRRLNQVRHEILQEWERHLPARPYGVEAFKLFSEASARPRYVRVQSLYMLVPILVMVAYLALAISIAAGFRFVDVPAEQ